MLARPPKVLLGIAALLGAQGVAAADQAPSQKLRIRYEAPSACPDGESFRRDLVRRSARIVLGGEADRAGQAWDVRIAASGDGFEGTLRSLDAPNDAEPQVQRGPHCAAVASALALTLALTIDPDARTDLAPPSAEATAPPPPAPPLATAEHRRLAVSAGVGVITSVFEGPLGSIVVGVESRADPRTRRPVQLRGRVVLASEGRPPSGAEAKVVLAFLAVDACAFVLARGPFALRPCVGVEPGLAHASARVVRAPSDGNAFWLSASARLRGEVEVTSRLGLVLEGGAIAPLVRPRFLIDPPRRTATEAGPIGAEVVLSTALLFP